MQRSEQANSDSADRLVAAICHCGAAIARLHELEPAAWLDAANRLILEVLHEGVAVTARIHVEPGVNIEALQSRPSGFAGYGNLVDKPPMKWRALLWQDFQPWDRVAIDDRGVVVRSCEYRATRANDTRWNQSPCRAHRRSLGLYDFARAVSPIDLGAALILRIDGLHPDWCASQVELAVLAAVTNVAATSFHHHFIRPIHRRSELLESLTPVQRTIMPMLAKGYSERLIGEQLKKSPHTIHQHAKRIYATWNVDSRYALRDKWLGAEALPGYEPPHRKCQRTPFTTHDA